MAEKIQQRESAAVKMSIAQDFKSRVAEWYKSGMPEGTSFVLGETGATLQGLGAIESDIYMNGEKISTILKEHPEMTIREIQRIPEILDDPVLILKSRNSANVRENSRLVIFGTVKASDGRAVMCVMDLRPTENGLLLDDMQKVASAYTKDNHPDRFVQNSFVLHADEKRTIPLLRTIGFQMPITLQRYGSMGSITYKGPKVNLYGEKFSDVVSVGTTAETAKRKFSASADQTAAEQRKQNDKTALDYFGRTYKWSETGYVLLNGARLDFSGRHEGGPADTGRSIIGISLTRWARTTAAEITAAAWCALCRKATSAFPLRAEASILLSCRQRHRWTRSVILSARNAARSFWTLTTRRATRSPSRSFPEGRTQTRYCKQSGIILKTGRCRRRTTRRRSASSGILRRTGGIGI